ncbi:MAG: GtrA family protein [Rhodospirillales bacterium]|nr:GtrA family protein [Rhodospirillales bacterium]
MPMRPSQFLPTLMQFLRFGTVGTFGFVVDTAVVYATRGVLGLYGAGLLSFLVAASANWALNRVWTFRGMSSGALHRQWAMFLAANSIGFVLNRGAYFTLVTISALCTANPVIAVAAGSLTGMFANFTLSRRLVFR